MVAIESDLSALKTDDATLTNDLGTRKFDMSSPRREFQLLRGEVEIRIDHIEGMTNQTRAELQTLEPTFVSGETSTKSQMI